MANWLMLLVELDGIEPTTSWMPFGAGGSGNMLEPPNYLNLLGHDVETIERK